MAKEVNDNGRPGMTVTIQGREVALYFSSEPDTQVALQIKQALLGWYLAVGK